MNRRAKVLKASFVVIAGIWVIAALFYLKIQFDFIIIDRGIVQDAKILFAYLNCRKRIKI